MKNKMKKFSFLTFFLQSFLFRCIYKLDTIAPSNDEFTCLFFQDLYLKFNFFTSLSRVHEKNRYIICKYFLQWKVSHSKSMSLGKGGSLTKTDIEGKEWSEKFNVIYFSATRFSLYYISQGSDDITMTNNKNTFKTLSVCLR